MKLQQLMWIAWPAFMVACVLRCLYLQWLIRKIFIGLGSVWSFTRQGVYTVTFFVFWFIVMVSSALTTLLAKSPFEVNRCPLSAEKRQAGLPQTGS